MTFAYTLHGIACADNFSCRADDVFDDICSAVESFGGIARSVQLGAVSGGAFESVAYSLRQHSAGIVETVGKPLSGAAVVGQVEADILGNAFYVVAVYIPRAFGSGIAAALWPVIAVGGMVFVSVPMDAVKAESVNGTTGFVRIGM